MRTRFKVAIGALLTIAAVATAAIVIGERLALQRAQRQIHIEVVPVAYRSDDAALQRGRYLFETRGCGECHGANGAGHTIVDDGQGTRLAAPNITAGNPAIAAYRESDWVRSIRHGVAPDGHALRVMPSQDYHQLTDDDLAAIVAHVRSLPPAEGRFRATLDFPLPARVLYGFGAIPDAADRIDHALPPSRPVPEGPTVEYGAYVAQTCKGCHGPALLGGKIPGAPPAWPPAARLAPGDGSAVARYPDQAAFAAMFRSGKRPDGTAIQVMPFESLAKMSDVEIQALFAYLKALKPAA